VTVRVDESTHVASMEYDDDGSRNCRANNLLPPGRGNDRIVGRIELSSAANGGARISTSSSSTLGARTAQQWQQQPGQSSCSSSHDSKSVVCSQSDDLPVCTRVDGKNDFLHCNDDDDNSTERTFSRRIVAGIGDHPSGRSHSYLVQAAYRES